MPAIRGRQEPGPNRRGSQQPSVGLHSVGGQLVTFSRSSLASGAAMQGDGGLTTGALGWQRQQPQGSAYRPDSGQQQPVASRATASEIVKSEYFATIQARAGIQVDSAACSASVSPDGNL